MKGTKMIKNYPNYSINKDGEVFSNAQLKPKKLKQRIVSQSKKGYLQVSLYNNKCKRNANGQLLPKQLYVHRLVWEEFNGEIPKNMEIDHIDNNPRNNKLSNLQLVTRRSNMRKYNREKYSGLAIDNLKEIRELQKQGKTIRETSKIVGRSYNAVWRIYNNKRQISKMVNGKRKYTLIDFDYDKLV